MAMAGTCSHLCRRLFGSGIGSLIISRAGQRRASSVAAHVPAARTGRRLPADSSVVERLRPEDRSGPCGTRLRRRRPPLQQQLSGGSPRAFSSMRVVSDDEAEAMLQHWCVGLRSILMSSGLPGKIDHEAAVAALRELRKSPPAAGAQLEPFWSVLYLSVAFESELLLAKQSNAPPEVVLQIGNLATCCANAGLLQFSDQLLIAEWLNSQLVPSGGDLAPVPFPQPPLPVAAAEVNPWTLFATPTLGTHADVAIAGLRQRGFCVIDGFVGAVQAGVLATDFRAFVGDCAEASPPLLQPGELDETKRSQPSVRGDLITWLLGSELAPEWCAAMPAPVNYGHFQLQTPKCLPALFIVPMPRSCVGGFAQLLRTKLLAELRRAIREECDLRLGTATPLGGDAVPLQLIHEKNFLGKAMLTVYPPGSVGFAPHTDRANSADLRKISAVYYLNRGWREDDGGQLVLTPTDGTEKVSILPELDRLVLFWSDTVEHEVVATSAAAPPRVAVSFWFHEDLSPATDGEGGGTMSPLLQSLGKA